MPVRIASCRFACIERLNRDYYSSEERLFMLDNRAQEGEGRVFNALVQRLGSFEYEGTSHHAWKCLLREKLPSSFVFLDQL